MAVHDTRLLRSEAVAEGTMAFHFARPAGFVFEAGQNMQLTVGEGLSHPFTIASAPHEPDLMIATRMRDSDYKKALKNASPGFRASLDGPNGIMVLHEDAARPAVFLAGGIGITPFLSMARDAAHRRLPHRLHLFYANRAPEYAAFLDELRGLQDANPNFRLVPVTGFIARDMLERELPDVRAPVYYFAGPPGMTTAAQAMLADIGVAERDMNSEEFYGY